MTTPPGDQQPDPQQPGQQPGQQPDPTQPMGYWQQQSQQQPPAPGYGYPPQQGYGQPPYVAADHPRATTALVLGLIAVVGGVTCGLPLFVGPFAWAIGRRAVKDIDREPQRYGGRGMAMAGYVLGVVATVLLALAAVALVLLVAIGAAVNIDGFSEGGVRA